MIAGEKTRKAGHSLGNGRSFSKKGQPLSRALTVPALLTTKDSLTPYSGTTLEVSLGGIKVSIPGMRNAKAFPVGSLISVVFTLPGSRKPTAMQGVVCSTRVGSSGNLTIGASFLVTPDPGSFLGLREYFARDRSRR